MSKKQTKKERKTLRSVDMSLQQKAVTQQAIPAWASMINWLILLVLVLPLIFSRKTIDPAMTPRYIFLAIFVLLMTAVFLLIRKKPVLFFYPLPVKIAIGLGLACGFWILLMTLFAVNAGEAYYQAARYFLLLVLLFLVTVTVSNEESNILRLCKAFVFIAIIQGGIGILQYYEWGFTDLPGANAKPFGLMANRNLFGSAIMLSLPFQLYVIYKGSKIWKYITVPSLIITIIALLLSQTRSAWLGSIVVIFLSAVLVSIFSPAIRKKWIMSTLVGLASIALIVFLILAADSEGSLSSSIKERATGVTLSPDSSSGAGANAGERVKMWKKTLAMIKDHPLTGVGPGNWRVAIAPYGGNEMVWAYGNYIPDRPHNVYLQVASETGIPGAVLYFSMWALMVVVAFKLIARTGSAERRIITILMLAGLAGFACDSFFSFPTERFEHSVFMTIMAGTILGCYAAAETAPEKLRPVNKKIAVAFLLIAAINLFLAIQRQNFEIHMNLVKANDKLSRYQEVLDEVEAGRSAFITIDPDNKPLEMYSGLAYKGLKNYKKALEEMAIAKKYNPYSAMIYNNTGTIYTDMKMYDSAVSNYIRGLTLTPHFDVLYKNLAANYFTMGNYAACINAIGNLSYRDEYFTNMLNEAKRLSESKK